VDLSLWGFVRACFVYPYAHIFSCSRLPLRDYVLHPRIFVVKPEAKRPLGRSRHRWEDNIKTDLQEVGWGINWIDLAQDRDSWRTLMNAVMKLRVP